MRRSRLILAVILVVTVRGSAVAAQSMSDAPVVEWLLPRPSGNQINAVATYGSRWVAVGDAGTVTVSTDAGASWQAHTTLTLEALRDVVFLDSLRLLAVGERGVVLESADRGQHWQLRSSGTTNELRAVALAGRTLVMVGARGTVKRLSAPGKSWQTPASGVTTTLRGLAALSANTYVAVGDGGTILRSSDRGVTWRRTASHTPAALRAVLFTSARSGVAVGGDDRVWRAKRVVLFTTDGGATWRKADVPRGGRLYALAADAKRIVAVGEGGSVIESRDAGARWTSVPHDGTMWLGAAVLPNERSVVALGARGAIVRTDNSGKSWKSSGEGFGGALAALAQPTPEVILVGSATHMLRSSDGGSTFVQPQLPDSSGGVWRVKFADSQRAVAVGFAVGSKGLVLRSADGGKTWKKEKAVPVRYLSAVDHAGGRTWFAAGSGGGNRPSAFRSDDDGVTWVACACPAKGPIYDVDFGGKVGMMVGARGVIIRTADGGATWTRVRQDHTRAALRGVVVIDSTTAIVVDVDGIVLRTADGGATWSRVASTAQGLRAIDAIGPTVVAVGRAGTMAISQDAGLRWRTLRLPVATDFSRVLMSAPGEALATGIPIGLLRVRLHAVGAASSRQVPGGSQ